MDYLGYNTHVSDPGFAEGYEGSDGDTNGGQAPGAGMQVHHGVMLIIGTAAALLVTIGVVFRRPVLK